MNARRPDDEDLRPGLSVDQYPAWIQDGVKDASDAKVARFLSDPGLTNLDMALVGLPDDVRSNVLRVMLNINARPGDEMNMYLALYGQIKYATEQAPREIRSSTEELRSTTENFSDECQNFLATLGEVNRNVYADAEKRAREIAKVSVVAASTEESHKYRERLVYTTESLLQEFKKSIQHENKKTLGTEWKSLAVAAGVCLGFFGFGWLGHAGVNVGGSLLHQSSLTSEARAGRIYEHMYPDMTDSQKEWVKHWSSTHMVP